MPRSTGRQWRSEDPRAEHRLRAPPGPAGASAGVSPGKAARRPGEAPKATGARDNPKPGFEGGQLPLTQRIPKLKGFKNPFRVEYTIVNLAALEHLGATEVDPDVLRQAGLVHKRGLVKVLGVGELTRRVNVSAHAFSASAAAAIEAAGGSTQRPPAAIWARPPARQGQRAYQSVAAAARTGKATWTTADGTVGPRRS